MTEKPYVVIEVPLPQDVSDEWRDLREHGMDAAEVCRRAILAEAARIRQLRAREAAAAVVEPVTYQEVREWSTLKVGDVFVAGTFAHNCWNVGLLCEVKSRTSKVVKTHVLNGRWDIEFDATTGRAHIDVSGESGFDYTYIVSGPFDHHTYKNRTRYEVDYHGVLEEAQKRLDAVEGQVAEAPPSSLPVAPQKRAERAKEDAAFSNLVKAAHTWTTHMDQWEKFRFSTPYGPIYVTLTMVSDYPDSFNDVDDVLKNG